MSDFVRKINFLNMSNHSLNYEVGEEPSPNMVIENFIRNVHDVQEGDFVFCRSDYMVNGRLNKVIQNLPVPINLIIHGGDYLVNYNWLDSPKIKNLFCANLNSKLKFRNTNLFSIPWGWGEVRHGDPTEDELDLVWKSRTTFDKKDNLVYIPHHTEGYGDGDSARPSFFEELKTSKLWNSDISSVSDRVEQNKHRQNIEESKFCIVLPGASWANQPGRIWECLIRETIPIMKRSFSDWWQSGVESMSKEHDIPMIFVDEWDEIDEKIFEKKFDFTDLYGKLKHEYWENFMRSNK